MPSTNATIRLGTRNSLLAMKQSEQVADALRQAHPHIDIVLVPLLTTGDTLAHRSLAAAGGKGLFTREVELALLNGRIDLAVHSYKDVPVTMPLVDQERLAIAAVPSRDDPRDVLITRDGSYLAELAEGAVVGTTSVRRRCQLLSARPDLRIEPLRGNIDTRLRKLRQGCFDAIVLAAAGLRRAKLFDERTMRMLSLDECLPAAGQGALAVQCRADDARMVEMLSVLDDSNARQTVAAERAVVAGLNGDCTSPIGVLARLEGSQLLLRAAVGRRDGALPVSHALARGPCDRVGAIVADILSRLIKQGVPHDRAGWRP